MLVLLIAAARTLPLDDDVTQDQLAVADALLLVSSVQVAPQLEDVKIPPLAATATSLLPSDDEAIETQFSVGALCDQVDPKLEETLIVPLDTAAAILLPSADKATASHFAVPKLETGTQVLP